MLDIIFFEWMKTGSNHPDIYRFGMIREMLLLLGWRNYEYILLISGICVTLFGGGSQIH